MAARSGPLGMGPGPAYFQSQIFRPGSGQRPARTGLFYLSLPKKTNYRAHFPPQHRVPVDRYELWHGYISAQGKILFHTGSQLNLHRTEVIWSQHHAT